MDVNDDWKMVKHNEMTTLSWLGTGNVGGALGNGHCGMELELELGLGRSSVT